MRESQSDGAVHMADGPEKFPPEQSLELLKLFLSIESEADRRAVIRLVEDFVQQLNEKRRKN
jgi:hypothetical protein